MLTVEAQGPVLFVRLNRPEVRKAFNDELIAAITEELATLGKTPPAADELSMLKTFLQKQRAQKLDGEALWTSVCRAVLNLDEAITHP